MNLKFSYKLVKAKIGSKENKVEANQVVFFSFRLVKLI